MRGIRRTIIISLRAGHVLMPMYDNYNNDIRHEVVKFFVDNLDANYDNVNDALKDINIDKVKDDLFCRHKYGNEDIQYTDALLEFYELLTGQEFDFPTFQPIYERFHPEHE